MVHVDAADAARRWAHAWRTAWLDGDDGAVSRLYSKDAVFRSHPARPAHIGTEGARAYARQAFAEERAMKVWFGEPFLAGNERAAVEYWAVLRSEGRDLTLAGVALLRFQPDGLVAEQHDYWNMWEGSVEPWEGWGR
jgi:hypothetical protein